MEDIIENDENNKLKVNTNSGLTPYSLSEKDKAKEGVSYKNVKVTSVYDGDTFRADLQGDNGFFPNSPIRVKGIDTPEIKGKTQAEIDKALEAKQFTTDFLAQGQVDLENCVNDKYFRNACDVKVNGKDLATVILEQKNLANPYDGGKKTEFDFEDKDENGNTIKKDEPKYYKEMDVVDFINDENVSPEDYWNIVGKNSGNKNFIKTNIADMNKINFDKYVTGEGWNPDMFLLYQPKSMPTYDYVQNSWLATAAKSFAASAEEWAIGTGNVAQSVIRGVGSAWGNMAAYHNTNQKYEQAIQKETENLIDYVKTHEDYFNNKGLNVKLTDKNGKVIEYCPKELFDYIYGKIENSIMSQENKEKVRNEALQFCENLPKWQQASNSLIETFNDRVGYLNNLKMAGNKALLEFEESYMATAKSMKWFTDEIGLNLDEHDAKNPLAAELGSGAFSLALSLSGLFGTGVGYALPALFTVMAYDESIRHGLENGLSFRSAAARSLIPATISGALEALKVKTIINTSKTLKDAWLKTTGSLWLNETVQEIAQDASVMASEQLLGLASYELADYMVQTYQDAIFTSISTIPSALIVNKNLTKIAKRFLVAGYDIEHATRLASTIMEYGEAAVKDPNVQKDIRKGLEQAAQGRKYKVSSNEALDDDTKFHNPSASRLRKDKQSKIKQKQQEENIKEQQGQKPQDSGKHIVQEGTYKDLVENSQYMEGLFSGKINADEVEKGLHDVELKIKQIVKGSFLVSDDVADVIAKQWVTACAINFVLSGESVTPSQFVDSIFPAIIEGFSNNIANGFVGLKENVKRDLGGMDSKRLFKLIKWVMGASGTSLSKRYFLAPKMAAMAQFMANILKSRFDSISDVNAIKFSIAYIVSVAKSRDLNEILIENGLGEFAGKTAEKYVGTIHKVAEGNLQTTGKHYFRTQDELGFSAMGSNEKGVGIEVDFWNYASNPALGTTTRLSGEGFNIFDYAGQKSKQKSQYISFSSHAMANTYVHEMTHAVVNYSINMAKQKIAKGLPLNAFEKNLIGLVNDFAKKYDKQIKNGYEKYKGKHPDYYSSFESYRSEYLNEFIATTIEYGVMTGVIPDEAPEDLKQALKNIKRLNNAYHYGDNIESLTLLLRFSGGMSLKEAEEAKKVNNAVISEKEQEEKDNTKRQNVADASQQEAIDANGDLNPEILNKDGETLEEVVAHISKVLFDSDEGVKKILKVEQKEELEKIKNIKDNDLNNAEKDLASQLYNLMFKRNYFVTVVQMKQDINSIISDNKLSNEEKVDKINTIIKGLPDNNTALMLKAQVSELSEKKEVTDMDIMDLELNANLWLQDIALLEAYGLQRDLSNEDTETIGGNMRGIRIFFQDIDPKNVKSAIEFLPVDNKTKDMLSDKLSKALNIGKKGYNKTANIVGKVAKVIDSFLDKAYNQNKTWQRIVDIYHLAMTPISDLAKQLNPNLAQDMKRAVFAETTLRAHLMQPVNELAEAISKSDKFTPEDRRALNVLLINQNWEDAKQFLESKGIKSELLKQVYVRLTTCHGILKNANVLGDDGIGWIANYFPRIVRDQSGLFEYNENKKKQRRVDISGDLPPFQKNKTDVFGEGFGKEKTSQSKSSFMRKREIKFVDPEAIDFYYDSLDTLNMYFNTVARIQGLYTMLGDGAYKKINAVYLNKIAKSLYEAGVQGNEDAYIEMMKTVDDANSLAGNKVVEKEQYYRIHFWGKLLNELGYTTGNNKKDAMVAKVMDAFFLRSKPSGPFTIYRGINNITTINNIFNALSNLGDLVLSTYRYGFKNTIYGLGKAVKGKEFASVDIEPLIENLYEEFKVDNFFFNKALNKVFEYSGFKALDLMTKRAAIEAAISTLKDGKAGEKKYDEALGRLKFYFGDEIDIMTKTPKWEKVLESIKRGEEDEDVKFFVFNELSSQQPITLAEVPYYYNKYPWTRLFYQFKTFATKQVSFLFNEIVGNKLVENPQEGIKDLFMFFLGLLLVKVPEECLIGMVKGEDVSIPDEAVASIAQYFMINKKAYYEFRNAEIVSGVATMSIPMPTIVSRIWSDVDAVFTDSPYKAKTLSSVPVVGEPLRVAGAWTGKAYSYWFPAKH